MHDRHVIEQVSETLPLLEGPASGAIAWHDGRLIRRGEFLADVLELAEALPERAFAINLCTDRYLFLVAFTAVVARGACNLLIPTRQRDAITETLEHHPDACIVDDGNLPFTDLPCQCVTAVRTLSNSHESVRVPANRLAAMVYTSGSTGASKTIPKSWRALWAGAHINRRYLFEHGEIDHIVATVPPWHMYGLEWTVMLPLASHASIFCGDTFYPRDIRAALAQVDAERCLVTTPVHMRALLGSGLEFAPTRRIMSATAPLDPALARRVEALLDGRLFEIYGCSEAGSMASRLPAVDPAWRIFAEFSVDRRADAIRLQAAHVDGVVELNDVLEFAADGRFHLVGRDGDLVKIAGKRASLADLTQRLLTIEGVDDGVIFNSGTGGEAERLVALVVSRELTADEIRARFSQLVDPVFLPRPLRVVTRLPRTGAGKLRRRDLLDALDATPGRC